MRSSLKGSFRNGTVNVSFRSAQSVVSESDAGYATPEEGHEDHEYGDEERQREEEEVDRAVQFLSEIDGGETPNPDLEDSASRGSKSSWRNWRRKGDKVDRIKFKPYFKRPKLGNSCQANCFRRYPRMYACTCGVISPLLFLVGVSLLCGFFLGGFEYEIELDANDEAMRRRQMQKTYDKIVADTIHQLPTFCYMLYRNQTDLEMLDEAFVQVMEQEESFNEWVVNQPNVTGHTIVNITKFSDFMSACGFQAEYYANVVQRYKYGNISVDTSGDTTLSFNWNRCLNQTAEKRSNRIVVPTDKDVLDAQPEAQEALYVETWTEHFNQLHEEYLAEALANDPNGTTNNRRFRAFQKSLMDATGRDKCVVNVASSAWFWFTVMTTVGYGNQAPSSLGGRAMVFTVGFVSIILFASNMATTGTIISHIVFDLFHRLRLKILIRKEVMIFIWGLFWYTWMVLLSFSFMEWTKRRLFTDIHWQDAYWFSYISTSTVGLGDYFQTPEVLFINDLVQFSLSYLFGFVLLSTFLTELGNLLGQYIPDVGSELGKRLAHVGVAPVGGVLDGSRQPLDSAFDSESDIYQSENYGESDANMENVETEERSPYDGLEKTS